MTMYKSAIIIDGKFLEELDMLVNANIPPVRGMTVQETVAEVLTHIDSERLSREFVILDPEFEQLLTEEAFSLERLN